MKHIILSPFLLLVLLAGGGLASPINIARSPHSVESINDFSPKRGQRPLNNEGQLHRFSNEASLWFQTLKPSSGKGSGAIANLSNANLSNANLSNANLSNANLSNAKLWNTNLSHAKLYDANLSNANLSHGAMGNWLLQQIQSAESWQTATYDPKARKQLGLDVE